jgi:hypothetical protein
MKIIYHRQITQQAVGSRVSQRALDAFIAANIGQDKLRYQIGHDLSATVHSRGDNVGHNVLWSTTCFEASINSLADGR